MSPSQPPGSPRFRFPEGRPPRCVYCAWDLSRREAHTHTRRRTHAGSTHALTHSRTHACTHSRTHARTQVRLRQVLLLRRASPEAAPIMQRTVSHWGPQGCGRGRKGSLSREGGPRLGAPASQDSNEQRQPKCLSLRKLKSHHLQFAVLFWCFMHWE